MEFHHFNQDPQFPDSGVPDGFALVPLHLFLLIAQQLPVPHVQLKFAAFAKPVFQETVYDRAMSCSAN